MIIGLTGENCAGKGTVAEYLQAKGFEYYSLSDVVREALQKENKEIRRDNLIKKANELRQNDAGALAKEIIKRIEPNKKYVIDSIRNPLEVDELMKLKHFALVHVTAPARIRFERMVKRKRESDPKTYEEFMRIEEAERKNTDPKKQNLEATVARAKKTLVNDGAFSKLYDNINHLLAEISGDFVVERPSWDEYFMSIAQVVASRSNCMKRHVAAIIIRDKRIVSTGYNGTPRGVKNCNEGGCERCNNNTESGKNLADCVCSHGEENAIVQSAYHGIEIKGSTLYSTFSPCLLCTKMIINAGIQEVVYNAEYPLAQVSIKLLKEAGIVVRRFERDSRHS